MTKYCTIKSSLSFVGLSGPVCRMTRVFAYSLLSMHICFGHHLVETVFPKSCDSRISMNGSNPMCEAPWNFSWIVPNALAGTSCPQSIANLAFLKQQGIHHLVTLSPDFRPPTTDYPGIAFSYIPIEEFEPPTLEDMKRFIELCQVAKQKNEALAVHCRAGRGRTGTMAACYLVHFLDMSPEAAIIEIRRTRPWSVETYGQENAVFHYRDYLRSSMK